MAESGTIDCRRVEELLEPLLDGELEASAAAPVRAHLEVCDGCRSAFRLAGEIRAELRGLPTMELSAERLRAIKAVTSERRVWWRSGKSWRLSAAGLAAAAAALILVTTLALVVAPTLDRGRIPAREIAIDDGLTIPAVEAPGADLSREEIERAATEARFALGYLNRLAARAGLEVRDEVFDRNLVRPAARELQRGLEPLRGEAERTQESGTVGSTA